MQRNVILGVLLALSICSCGHSRGPEPAPALLDSSAPPPAPSIFPLTHDPSERFLRDRQGQPFPILGRTAWFVLALEPADYRIFLNDSVARGYNSIELHVLNHDPRGRHPPRDGAGTLPFRQRLDGREWAGSLSYAAIDTDAPDFTTPDPDYWRHVDAFLAACEARNILVFFFPAYLGYHGGQQGWMQEMLANGPDRIRRYGAWIASRYRGRGNLVWMLGGDLGQLSPPQSAVEAALLAGIESVADRSSRDFSAEWDSTVIGTDQPQFGGQLTLNSDYAWNGKVALHGRRAYAHSPTLPAFLLEEPYDEEGPDGNHVNPHATQPVRRFQWAGWLSTIGGYISGNAYVWPFAPSWKSHLATRGSSDMSVLNAFMKSIEWHELVPSGLGGTRMLVVAGGGTVESDDYVAAAATPAGGLLVAYVPPAHSGGVTIDMRALRAAAHANWLNPTSGHTLELGVIANSAPHEFQPPGDNGTGFSDWVLVLRAPVQ